MKRNKILSQYLDIYESSSEDTRIRETKTKIFTTNMFVTMVTERWRDSINEMFDLFALSENFV